MRILSSTEVLARFGKALADPTRAAVLLTLRNGPAFPSDLAERIGVSRQILSNHLACLRDCGLVVGRPEGRQMFYSIAHPLPDQPGTPDLDDGPSTPTRRPLPSGMRSSARRTEVEPGGALA